GWARAAAVACSPTPEATSSTRASAARCAFSTARIGGRFRAVAGELSAPTGAGGRRGPVMPVCIALTGAQRHCPDVSRLTLGPQGLYLSTSDTVVNRTNARA